MTGADVPMTFADAEALAGWLARHHAASTELLVRIYRKGSGVASVTWNDCVVEAIRFGWIDGQKRALDHVSFLQRLTPRRARSNWSARNRGHAERLIAEGRMTPAGLAQVEAARADGRWDRVYAGSADMEIPADFLTALAAMPAASAFYDTLDRANRFAIYYRLHTARRADTRARRMERLLAQLDRGERFR